MVDCHKLSMSRTVYIVATPMGHLGDISQRACEVLSTVDIILAEHPMHTRKMLASLGVKHNRIKSCHQHNEKQICQWLTNESWESIALVSDAGTPNIQDPGGFLARYVYQQGYKIVPIPGPSAVIAALSIIDVPAQPSIFYGFLSSQASERRRSLESLKYHQMPMVFYESPHRVSKSVTDMSSILGDRTVWLCRELTKHYEQVVKSSLYRLPDEFEAGVVPKKGEFVIVVAGAENNKDPALDWQSIVRHLDQFMGQRELVAFAVEHLGCRRNEVYQFLLGK